MAPNANSATLSEEIDELLEHYLELLDQYTKLRAQLSTVQSSVYQHISRANFSAERGIRYGPDFYDARMQAARVCRITVPSPDTATTGPGGVQQEHVVQGHSLDDVEPDTPDGSTSAGNTALKGLEMDTACFTISTAADAAEDGVDRKTKKAKDPLRMFGLLTPQSLKMAQVESIKAVQGLVPRLVSVDAEMQEVEIRIRRARKWKAKAEAQEKRADISAESKGAATRPAFSAGMVA